MPPRTPKQWPPVARLTLVLQNNQTITVSTTGTIPGKVGQGRNRVDSILQSWVLFWGDGQQEGGQGAPPLTLSHTYAAGNTTVFIKLVVTDVNTLTAQATITVNVPGTTLDPPTGVTAVLQLANSVLLTWVYPTQIADSFQIYRSTGTDPLAPYATVAGTVRSYTDPGLTASTTYNYAVAAVAGANVSAPSATASVTTSSVPAAPTLLNAVATSATTIDLAWTDNAINEDGYQIERSTGGTFALVATVGNSVSAYTDTGLTPSTTYSYRVRAYNVLGASAYSNTDSDTTPGTVPNAPSNLTATAVSAAQINLAWTNNGPATSIRIERKIGAGAFAPLTSVSGTDTSFSDTGLTASTTYSYRLFAVNGAGDSAASNTASATTQAAVTVPAAPSALNAVTASASAINLTWTDNSTNEAGFAIERAIGAGAFAQIATVGAGVVAYGDTGLSESTIYRYQVRAYNTAGFSAYSNQSTATTSLAVPNAPTNLSATATSPTAVHLAWTVPVDDSTHGAAANILVQRRISPAAFATIDTISASLTAYDDATAVASTTYDYRLIATNAAGNSSASNTASVTTPAALPTPPAAPSGLTATAVSATQVNLAWTDNSATEAGFVIQRSVSAGPFADLATVAANVVSYSDLTVVGSTSYQYRVYAYNAGGNSANSNTASVTTPSALPPTAPTLLTAVPQSTTSIALAFQDNSTDETGFTIERKLTGGVYVVIKTLAAGVTSYLDATGTPATTYTYRVRAFNANGNSAYTNEATATTFTPTQPIAPTCTLGVDSQSVAGIPVGTATTVFLSATPGSSPLASWIVDFKDGTTANGSGVPPATLTHTYPVGQFFPSIVVTDTNGLTGTDFGGPATINPAQTIPVAPSNLSGSQTAPSQVTLNWQDNSTNEDGFNVERKLSSQSTYGALANTGANVATYQDNAVTQGNTYNYRTRAFNAAGNSGYSNVISVGLPVGADYYVAPGGNDGAGHTGSQSDPFATFQHALEVASAALSGSGKVIWGRAATYDQSINNPNARGTSATNRIRVSNFPGEVVTIAPSFGSQPDYVFDLQGGNGGQAWLEFDGININGTNAKFSIGKIGASSSGIAHHIRFANADVTGIGVDFGVDNHVNFFTIQHNIVAQGFNEFYRLVCHGGISSANFTLPTEVFYLNAPDNVVDSCEVYGTAGNVWQVFSSVGLPCNNNVLKNNYWHDIVRFQAGDPSKRIVLGQISGGHNNTQYYNNIAARCGTSGATFVVGIRAGSGASNTKIWNNLHYQLTGGNGLGYEVTSDVGGGTQFNNNIGYLCTQNDAVPSSLVSQKLNNFMSGNPQFMDEANSNWQLAEGSTCIDGGIPAPFFTTDRVGVLRPQRSAWDIGPYEKP